MPAAWAAIALAGGLAACTAVPPPQYARARGAAAGAASVFGTPELTTLAAEQGGSLAIGQPEYARGDAALGAYPRRNLHPLDPVGAEIERLYRWDRYQVDRVQLLPLLSRRVPGW